MSDTQADQPPNKLAEGVPPHTSHYACDERVALYGDKTIGCCCTGHMCEPKDQPVDEQRFNDLMRRFRREQRMVLNNDGVMVEDYSLIKEFIQAECNRARWSEVAVLGNYLLDERMSAWDAIHRREKELQQLSGGES